MNKITKISIIGLLSLCVMVGTGGTGHAITTIGVNSVINDGVLTITAASASTWSTGGGVLTIDGSAGILLVGNAGEIDLTTTDIIDINSAGGTWDASTLSIDSTGTTNLTMTANVNAPKTLSIISTNSNSGGSDEAIMALTADDEIILTTTNKEIQLTAGTADVVIAGSAAGTDAFKITAGDLLLADSDENIINSTDGVLTMLLLDNVGGVIGTGKSVLKLDAGGNVHASSYILDVVYSGTTPAPGATAVNVDIKKAGVIGINIDGAGTATREALKIDADTTGNYHVVSFHSDSVLASNFAVLNVDAGGDLGSGAHLVKFDLGGGTPNAAAIPILIDAASIAGATKPTIMKIDAGGADAQALEIDADPTSKDVVSIHSDAVILSGKAVLALDTSAAIASGSNLLRITTAGTPDTGAIVFEMDAQDDCQALKIDTASATHDSVYIAHTAGALASTKSVLHVTDAGDPGGDDRYVGHFALTGANTHESAILFADGGGKDVTGILVDCDPTYAADNLSGQLTLYSDAASHLPILMNFYHDDSGAASGEYCAKTYFYGHDDNDAKELYASIEIEQDDASNANPDGILWIKGDLAGTNTVSAGFTGNMVMLGATDSTLTSAGSWDLTLSTNKTDTNEPRIVLTDGATSDITITAGGTSGEINLVSNVLRSVTAVTALGNNHGTGAAMTTDINFITNADSAKGVVLPTAVVGLDITVINQTAGQTLKLYGYAVGQQINGVAGTTAYVIAAISEVRCTCLTTTNWECETLSR